MGPADADGRGALGQLHRLTADFDARRLLGLLTAEEAHSMNLWMQQRHEQQHLCCLYRVPSYFMR